MPHATKSLALDVAALRAPMQQTHDTGVNFSTAWRRTQLETLQRMVNEHRHELLQALYQDLGKHRTEAACTELIIVENEIEYFLKHLSSLTAVRQVPTPAVLLPAFSSVTHRPLSAPACLVIGPSNYPVSLSLQPTIGSLAAGNPTVLKPSELCLHVSRLLQRLVAQYFDPSALVVVQGGVAETTALLKEPWGLVFFTGSERVGKLVAAAAAQTLSPVILELGGKCPCYVDETAPADIKAVANRIIWAKLLNAGQTCAAIDTLIVHVSLVDKLVPELVATLRQQFGVDPAVGELGRIVDPGHAARHVALIQEVERAAAVVDSPTKMIVGGSATCDARSGYVCPTIVLNPPADCRLATEEIFGPILPIRTVASRAQAIQVMRDMPGTPLCLYVFTKSAAVFDEIKQKCPSASAMRNDALVHLASLEFPFGGLGTSGYGGYHGKHSFESFSHQHLSMYRPCAPGIDLCMARYHPFGNFKGPYLVEPAVRLPSVPVLHCKAWMLLLTVAGALRYVPAGQELVKIAATALASVLERSAAFLREGA